jgi:hypothetical protein
MYSRCEKMNTRGESLKHGLVIEDAELVPVIFGEARRIIEHLLPTRKASAWIDWSILQATDATIRFRL